MYRVVGARNQRFVISQYLSIAMSTEDDRIEREYLFQLVQ